MTDGPTESRRERYERQTKEQYAALGRYVQQFELVSFYLRYVITLVLHQDGLRNQQLADIIVGHHAVTAQTLLDTACALLVEVHSGDKDAISIMHHFRNRFSQEIRTRNTYLHGTWLMGWASESQQDFSDLGGFKLSPSPKLGAGTKDLAKSVQELQARIDELVEIEDGFKRLMGCLLLKREVKKNFITVDGRYVSPDTARRRGWSC
jgi:hypothetical protein